MKCIVKTAPGPGNLELQEKESPVPGEGELLIKVKYAAICGTDIHIKQWAPFAEARIKPPVTIGHEFVGTVVDVGDKVDESWKGRRVSADSHVPCGKCPMCRDNKQNLCLITNGIGITFDGCFAEYLTIPEAVAYPVDDAIPDKAAAIREPLGTAVYAATLVNVAGKSVGIQGAGPIGLMAVAVFKKAGASKVVSVEINEGRAKAAENVGADRVINPIEVDIVREIKNEFEGLGPDIVIECSGNPGAIRNATEYVRPGGDIIPIALPSKDVTFNFTETFYKGVNMHGISGRQIFHTWKVMNGLLKSGMDVSGCISHVYKLDDFEEAFEMMESGKSLKVLFEP